MSSRCNHSCSSLLHFLNISLVSDVKGSPNGIGYSEILWWLQCFCWHWWLQSQWHSIRYYPTIYLDYLLYRPDIVIYNAQGHEIRLLELTCPFNSTEHLQAARERKSNKVEYQLLLSELDRLGYISQYLTIEIGCLGHYLSDSIRALQATTGQSTRTCRSILDNAAQKAISCSQQIFLARNCIDWNIWSVNWLFVYVFCAVVIFIVFLAMPVLCFLYNIV